MIWLAMALGIAGGGAMGWYTHEWFCMRRNGCLIWIRNDAAEWSKKLKAEGWRTKNGRQHHARVRAERPTTEIATLDNLREAGAPSERVDTPTTGVVPRRKTP